MDRKGTKEAKKKQKGPVVDKTFGWSETAPFTVRAMVATAESLVVAGVPALGQRPKSKDPNRVPLQFENPVVALEAFRGERGGYLRIVSKEDGSLIKELKLDGVPVSDGMSVTNGELFISLKTGVLCCYGK